jgi:hypothetical protein
MKSKTDAKQSSSTKDKSLPVDVRDAMEHSLITAEKMKKK